MSVEGNQLPTSNSQHPTSNEDDLRTMVQSLWEGTIRDGDRPEMTLKGETKRGRSAGGMPEALKVRPKDIAEKGRAGEVPEYEILRMLGEGGMGMVYEARQTAVDRSIAVKMIKPDAAKDQEASRQFLAEAVATADLDHPNIVPIHDLGMNSEGALFYAMKQVKGTSWKDLLPGKSVDENLDILMRVADAVAFAHNRGVIHRDLKPENVMLGDFGEVLLMDWGLAAAIREDAKADPLDPQHAIGGTPSYMAPEMAVGDAAKIGYASDVYLLGAILFEIVTGQRSHTGTDVMDCLANAAENVIVETDQEGELLDIARKAMATEPDDRFETVKAFQSAVREFQRHEESIALVAKATEGLEEAKSSADYSAFARAVFQFEEALALWPENKPAGQGVVGSKLAYAECAFEKRDYDLAVSLLDRNETSHRQLLDKVEAARRERDARRKRMGVLKVTSVVSAAAALLVLSVATFWVNRARRQADVQRDRAENALHSLRDTAPTFYALAQEMVSEMKLPEALTNINYAVSLVPAEARYHNQRGNILQSLLKIDEALSAYETAVSHDSSVPHAQANVDLCRKIAKDNEGRSELLPASIGELLAAMQAQERYPEVIALSRSLQRQTETIAPVLRKMLADAGLPPKRLKIEDDGTTTLSLSQYKIDDLSPLQGLPIDSLILCFTDVIDLSPLKGMPLISLNIVKTGVKDLSPLAGMQLRSLLLGSQWGGCPVKDLSPLKGMRLASLDLAGTPVADLSPLKGMPLEILRLASIQDKKHWRGSLVTDLSPLKGMPLKEVTFVPECITAGFDVIREIETLTKINDAPAAVFWQKHDAGEFFAGAEFKDRIQRAWPGLRLQKAEGKTLSLGLSKRADVVDLSPLKGIPLKELSIGWTKVSDLSPLKGLPLISLTIPATQVQDLSPLTGLPLERLDLGSAWGACPADDLTPLKGMPLTSLNLRRSPVSDLSPLSGMALTCLDIRDSRVKDISPLEGMPLKELSLSPDRITTGLAVIRSIKSLKTINGMPAATFWEKYDAGEFGK